MFRGLTVQGNLRLGAYRQTEEKVVQAQLEAVFELSTALAERRRQGAHTLSGGKQQMLAIGRAMQNFAKTPAWKLPIWVGSACS